MPERISDELLAQSPVTHDEHARALKELIYERVMQNRRKDADAQQDAALAKLAEENAKANSTLGTLPDGQWPPWVGNNFGGMEAHPADDFHSDVALARKDHLISASGDTLTATGVIALDLPVPAENPKPTAKAKAKKEK